MSEAEKMELKLLPTGIPGLDEVLGGGLPEYSFVLVAGAPGAGKTTLAHQIVFGNASVDRRALYFTVMGEPPLKMLRYQQQLSYFVPKKVGAAIRFVDLSPEVLAGDLGKVLEKIRREVEESSPAFVVIDSFRTVLRAKTESASDELELQSFLQRLAVQLASWQVTSFLIGEYSEGEMVNNPIFTVADGILWLSQERQRNSVVRKLEIMKLRGVAAVPGLHTFRISRRGISVFPRTTVSGTSARRLPTTRISSGIPGLDELLGGGLPVGDATLVAGPSGTGKTTMGTQFIAEGLARGESAVLAIFEEHPADYLARAKDLGFDLAADVEAGRLRVIYTRPLDLSSEEILHQVEQAVSQIGARRLVIDSLNGVELALAPTFRDDFRESLYRMTGRMTGRGVSIVFVIEVMETFEAMQFSPHAISFLTQNILFLRYMEIAGQLRKMIVVIKMRRSGHSKDLHELEITPHGMRILGPLTAYEGVLRGTPTLRTQEQRRTPGLTDQEAAALERLTQREEATLEELAAATGFGPRELAPMVGRLVALNYAIEIVEETRTLYRVAERTLGAT